MTEGRLSKFLPPSLGTMFGQPVEREVRRVKPMPPASIPGAYNAPELCLVVDQYLPELLPPDPVGEVKIDGLRCLWIAGQLTSREGSPFEAAEHCRARLEALERSYGQPMFFDGEYVEDGGVEATLSAFRSRKGSGCLWLFDAVPFDQWQSGRPAREGLEDRKARLERELERTYTGPSEVGFVKSLPVDDAAYLERMTRDLWSQGFEGVVVKSRSSRYVRKRTCDWMKVKLRTVTDMVVVDTAGCTRSGVETMQSLLVRLPGHPPSRTIRLPVNGGLADTLWRSRGALVGTMVKVEHAGFTGAGNPREAVLKQVTLPA